MRNTLNCQTEFGSVQWVIEYTGPTVHCDPNNFRIDWEVTGNALDNSLHFLVSPNEEQLQTLGGQPWLHQLSFLSLYFPEKKKLGCMVFFFLISSILSTYLPMYTIKEFVAKVGEPLVLQTNDCKRYVE